MADRKLGDFNNDGDVDGRDATELLTYVGKMEKCDPDIQPIDAETFWAGDVMNFNRLCGYDAEAILKTYNTASVTDDLVTPKTRPATWDTIYKKFVYIDSNGNIRPMSEIETPPPFDPSDPGYLGPYYCYCNYCSTLPEFSANTGIAPYLAQLP